jgi:hypothetical protein
MAAADIKGNQGESADDSADGVAWTKRLALADNFDTFSR